MARIQTSYLSLNVGVFDTDKLHRVDVDRIRLGAERQTNFLCDSIGTAYPRPGFEYIVPDDARLTDWQLPGVTRPIVFAGSETTSAIMLLSDEAMRVYDNGTGNYIQREAVGTAVTNGDFGAAGGWTLSTASGQSTTISGGKLTLSARAHGAQAMARSSFTINYDDLEHALRIVVDRGPITFKLGSSLGGDQLIQTTTLRTGVHSLAFTPTGVATAYIEFTTDAKVNRIVDSCEIEYETVPNPSVPPIALEIPTIWAEADLNLIRTAQSLDVMFIACTGYRRQRIERRGNRSWSVVDYDSDDGPFQPGRSDEVTLTPGALEGNTTLTSSGAFFKPGHVGALFRLFHEGQSIDTYVVGSNSFSQAFLVTGITEANFEERKFSFQVSGTWAGTIRQRRSFNGEFGDYVDFRREQASGTINITANATYTNDDNDDNIEVWVKAGFPEGLYTSGEARIRFTYQGGGGYGIARVVAYNSATSVDIEILVPFKGLAPVKEWRQSRYDGVNGHPSAVTFADGRLTWQGDDLFDGSVSDAYDSFDENFAGDAGPLSRSIALDGRNSALWSVTLSSLIVGCDTRLANVRSSSLDEVLTPTNYGVKSISTYGAAPITPAELGDDRLIYVQATGTDLFEVIWAGDKGRYESSPFSKLTTKLFTSGIKSLSVQTLPDQRIWVTTQTGDACCIIFEPRQQVLAAHIPISTSNDTDHFEYFCVLPEVGIDRVFAVVKRGSSYYFERMAPDSATEVGDVCRIMDSHLYGDGAHAALIEGLEHLEGREVVAWVDGAPVRDATITDPALDDSKVFTVFDGKITLPSAPTAGWCVGLRYEWHYKSARLAYGVEGYSPMLKNKSLVNLGFLLSDFVRDGFKYGAVGAPGDFDAPWNLPDIDSSTGTTGAAVVEGEGADENMVPVGDVFSLDTRLCLSGASPKPFAVRAMVLDIESK